MPNPTQLQYCVICGGRIYGKRMKYCSDECAKTIPTPFPIATKQPKRHKTLDDKVCPICGKLFIPHTDNHVYCSEQCYQDARRNLVVDSMLTGTLKSLSTIKRLLRQYYANTCQKCGLKSWQDATIVMEVHHIDGDKHNNNLSNLTLLCPNCHSQTETFRGKNKKKSPS